MAAQLNEFGIENAVRYQPNSFPPKDIDFANLVRPLGQAALSLGRYDAQLKTLPNQHILLAPMRSREAVQSSRIEGTIATLEEIVALEGDPKEKDEFVRPQALEVLSYIRALNHAERLVKEGLPISSRLIRETHGRMLFTGARGNTRPGQFKDSQNYVVDKVRREIVFIPIAPETLPDGLRNLEIYLNDRSIDPLIRTALGHAEFEALHPFADGNGRVGRMLITLGLWETSVISQPAFYVSSEIEQHKEEYIERLRRVSSDNDWNGWLRFFLEVLDRQAIENSRIADKIVELYDSMKERFPSILGSAHSILALDAIFRQPIFTNGSLARAIGVSPPTAQRFTRLLLAEGLIDLFFEGGGSRATRYIFEPLFDTVRA